MTGSPDDIKINFAKYSFGQSYANFVMNKIKIKINNKINKRKYKIK